MLVCSNVLRILGKITIMGHQRHNRRKQSTPSTNLGMSQRMSRTVGRAGHILAQGLSRQSRFPVTVNVVASSGRSTWCQRDTTFFCCWTRVDQWLPTLFVAVKTCIPSSLSRRWTVRRERLASNIGCLSFNYGVLRDVVPCLCDVWEHCF